MLNIEKKKSNEVRISVEMYRDPDGHGRGSCRRWKGYARPCKTENRDVSFRIPITTYFHTIIQKMLMIEEYSSKIKT